MTKNSKYSSKIDQHGSYWKAQINRQVTSKKTIVSKEQGGFASEAEANKWAEQQLAEFITTQSAANQRHSEFRKKHEKDRLQKSVRRAEKTQNAKKLNTEDKPGTGTLIEEHNKVV